MIYVYIYVTVGHVCGFLDIGVPRAGVAGIYL